MDIGNFRSDLKIISWTEFMDFQISKMKIHGLISGNLTIIKNVGTHMLRNMCERSEQENFSNFDSFHGLISWTKFMDY